MDCETHFGIAQHDHPYQDHVDVDSQWLVMVNLVHLKSKGQTINQRISFRASLSHKVTPHSVINCGLLFHQRRRARETQHSLKINWWWTIMANQWTRKRPAIPETLEEGSLNQNRDCSLCARWLWGKRHFWFNMCTFTGADSVHSLVWIYKNQCKHTVGTL